MFGDNIALDLASRLFSFRVNKKISLENVSKQTQIAVAEIDALEIYAADIDFNIVAILLDFYGKKLEGYERCFPGLPQDYYQEYF